MEPHTITAALREHRQPPSAYVPYSGYLTMTARFLGEQPTFYPILSLSPAAMRTHVGLFARMFHSPGVDMRLPGWLSPELRRAAFLASSEAFNCTYCTAHAVCFGDMFRGSKPSQVARGGTAGRGEGGEAESAVKALAVATVQRPETEAAAEELQGLARDVKDKIGSSQLEIVSAVFSFAGALNTCMFERLLRA